MSVIVVTIREESSLVYALQGDLSYISHSLWGAYQPPELSATHACNPSGYNAELEGIGNTCWGNLCPQTKQINH